MSFWDEEEAKRLFQKLPFYVLIKTPRIKHLKNIDLLYKIPFIVIIVIKYCGNIRGV